MLRFFGVKRHILIYPREKTGYPFVSFCFCEMPSLADTRTLRGFKRVSTEQVGRSDDASDLCSSGSASGDVNVPGNNITRGFLTVF